MYVCVRAFVCCIEWLAVLRIQQASRLRCFFLTDEYMITSELGTRKMIASSWMISVDLIIPLVIDEKHWFVNLILCLVILTSNPYQPREREDNIQWLYQNRNINHIQDHFFAAVMALSHQYSVSIGALMCMTMNIHLLANVCSACSVLAETTSV